MQREIKYDLLRIIAMTFVVLTHVNTSLSLFTNTDLKTWFVFNLIVSVVYVENPLFFMLSGKFNLKKIFDTTKDYLDFYIRRFINILVPFLICNLYYLYKFYDTDEGRTLLPIEYVLDNRVEGTFWFVFIMIALIITSPFISKMVQKMSKVDKKMFFWGSVVVTTLMFLARVINIDLVVNQSFFPFLTWAFYYILGYIIDDVFDNDKLQSVMITLLPIIIIFKMVVCYYLPHLDILRDLNGLFMIQCVSMYYLVMKLSIVIKDKGSRIITFISKHSFSVYLLHPALINIFKGYFDFSSSFKHRIFSAVILFIIVYILAILLSWILDSLLFNPLIKLCNKGYSKLRGTSE